jgi:hypothetical protein
MRGRAPAWRDSPLTINISWLSLCLDGKCMDMQVHGYELYAVVLANPKLQEVSRGMAVPATASAAVG